VSRCESALRLRAHRSAELIRLFFAYIHPVTGAVGAATLAGGLPHQHHIHLGSSPIGFPDRFRIFGFDGEGVWCLCRGAARAAETALDLACCRHSRSRLLSHHSSPPFGGDISRMSAIVVRVNCLFLLCFLDVNLVHEFTLESRLTAVAAQFFKDGCQGARRPMPPRVVHFRSFADLPLVFSEPPRLEVVVDAFPSAASAPPLRYSLVCLFHSVLSV